MQRRLGYGSFGKITVPASIVLGFLYWTGIALAQGAPPDYQIGFPPHGDFSGTDFESVQINNNNLHIEIPLWSTSGRGPSVGRKYVYDSKGWGFNENCSRISGTCTDHVTAHPVKAGVVGNHLSFTLVGPQSYQVSAPRQTYTCSGGVQIFIYSYNMSAPDGTHHHFLPDPVQIGGNGACVSSSGTLYADDGSGWVIQTSTGKITGKDGTVGGNAEDTNGNEVNTTDTLGRQINNDGSYYDSNGVLRTVPVTYQTLAIQTHLCWSSSADYCYEYSTSNWGAPHVITLPNGMTYTFAYDNGSPTHPYYGQPLSVTLPTGGTITWGWNGEGDSGPTLISRQLSGDPAPWLYSGGKVTDPAGNDVVYGFTAYKPPYSPILADTTPYVTQKQYYQGSSTSGTLIKTVQTDYWVTTGNCMCVPAILPIHETTTWNQQNLVSRTETDYDSYPAWGNNATAGNAIEKREFAYGTGTWGAQIRTTDYGYLHLSNSTYLGLNILDRVTSHMVYAGSSQTGTLVAQTTNTYDGVAIPTSGDTSANPAPNHDYTNFSRSNNLRGNLTQVSRGLKSGSTWTWLSTNNTYNDLGELLTSTDPLNHQTSYDYTDSWATISNAQCVTSAHSYAFPTTITDPLGHRLKHQFFSCTSFVSSEQDENDIQASRSGAVYAYDFMGRLASKSFPDGGSATYTPNDTALPYSVAQSTLVDLNAGLSIGSTTVFDGLGRVQQIQKHDPDCTTGVVKGDRTYGYGAQGATTQLSTPYCNSPSGNYGLMTTTNVDALGRPVSLQQPDGSATTTSYAGNCQTVTDEAGKSRQSCFDALGRLTQVLEDPGTTPHLNYETDYGYDVLNNLTSLTQKGGAASSQWRTRSFTYDSLSRLTCAANPETTSGLSTVNQASCPATYAGSYTAGTIGYTYDGDGEVVTKTAPAPNQTGTSTVAITYSYNSDHQLIGKTYSDGTTPSAQFGYNGTAISGCTTTPPTLADSNPVHTRTAMCDGSGATSWAHDSMGRVLTEKRSIVGTSTLTNTIQYSYYKDGELNVVTYPNSNRQITYTVNSSGGYTAGRAVKAVDTTNNVNHATGATYAPQGGLASLTIGASVNGAETYNARMQPLQMYYTAGTISSTTLTQLQQSACPTATATIMSRSYNFGQGSNDNGAVQSITNCRDTNRTQNFVYDSLNRIQQAYSSGSNWGETFGPVATNPGVAPSSPGIDPWGNLTNRSGVIGKTNYEPLNVAPASIKNQLNGFCNDSAGNLVLNTACPTGTFTPTYSYDAENRLIATGGVTYTYDGNGRRVKKSNGTIYWTGTGSDALLETDLSGNPTAEYVFFNGRRIARIDRPANSVVYYYADHLGSTDVVTSATGAILKESDYYPYGGEMSVITGDANRYKFNGKERDSESNLDNFGARYNASNLGRFMSPDWAARPTAVPYAVFGDPQSLNLYGYVRNDPVSRADLDGHEGVEHDALHGDQPCGISNVCSGSTEATPSSLFGTNRPSWVEMAAFQQRQAQRQAQRQNTPAQNTPAQKSSAAAPALKGPYVADLKSKEIAPLLDPNHKPSDQDIVGPNGECVDLTKKFSGMGDVSAKHEWYPGETVSDAKDMKPGTAIASFDGKGRFPSESGWNSGIYLGHGANGSIWILDQWPGHAPAPRELLLNNNALPANNSAAYSVILTGPWR
jgi:RHS repeat-associated protein